MGIEIETNGGVVHKLPPAGMGERKRSEKNRKRKGDRERERWREGQMNGDVRQA